jgi:multiple sugar transport system permease protein
MAPAKPISHFFGKTPLARRDALYGYLFILPQMLGFFAFVLGPLLAVFVFSTQNRSLLQPGITFVGLANYERLLTKDPLFWQVMGNTLVFAGGLVPLNVVLALVLALVVSQKLRGIVFFRTLYFVPVVTSAVAWAIVWRFLLQGERGTINQILTMIGIEGPNWLRDPGWAMFWVILTRTLKGVGINMIIFLAAIMDLPGELFDAASVDGANGWQRLRHITLPLLAPTTLLVTLLVMIGSLKVFDTIFLMTAGGPANATLVLVNYIYVVGFQFFESGYASALSVVLFLITLGLTLLQWGMRRRFSYNEQ